MNQRRASTQDTWLAMAKSLRRRINLGWFMQKLAPSFAASAIIGATILLLARSYRPALFDDWWLIAFSIICALPLIGTYLTVKRSFENIESCLVRLESRYNLNAALSSAYHGKVSWPPLPARTPPPLRWNFLRSVVPTLFSISLLTSSLLVPVTPQIDKTPPSLIPTSWRQLEADANALKNNPLIDKQYPEALEKKLAQLKKQKADDWYSHASQEAAAQLSKEHRREVDDMRDAARRARQAAGGLKQKALAPGRRQQLAEQLKGALKDLDQGKLKPNKELFDKLQKLNPEALKEQLTPEQLEQLQEQMKNLADQMEQMQAGDNGEPEGGDGEQGEKRGGDNGEPKRGPGDGGDPSSKPKAPLKLSKPERLESENLRPALGDKLDTLEGKHQVEKSPHRLKRGGSTDATGQGGDRILRNRIIDPRERALLERYFSNESQQP